MASFYAVSAVRSGGRQVPTFYLIAAVQGIVSEEHAERIARDILGPDASITVVALDVFPTDLRRGNPLD